MRTGASPSPVTELEGVLEIGLTRIAYRVRESARAKRKRIVVEPGSVEVVLPVGEPAERAHRFVYAKRRWVFDKVRELGEPRERTPSYLSGTKVRYRGRWLTVEVGVGSPSVICRSRFYITLPRGVRKADRAAHTERLLRAWMHERLLQDGRELARRYAHKAGVEVRDVSVMPMKRMWASCGKDRVVRLNADLIELPRAILEYVVAHELAHLVVRNHSPAFWRVVGDLLPDWRERQRWLNRYERPLEL